MTLQVGCNLGHIRRVHPPTDTPDNGIAPRDTLELVIREIELVLRAGFFYRYILSPGGSALEVFGSLQAEGFTPLLYKPTYCTALWGRT